MSGCQPIVFLDILFPFHPNTGIDNACSLQSASGTSSISMKEEKQQKHLYGCMLDMIWIDI